MFWRITPTSGFGHVGFYCSETSGYVEVLGGNEHDSVRKELLAKRSANFGLIGYWWPQGYSYGEIIAPIAYHSGSQVGSKVT